MKWFKSLSNLRKGILISAFSILFIFGFTNQADAKMFGKSEGCTECVLGTRMCTQYIHIFWIKFENGQEHEAC